MNLAIYDVILLGLFVIFLAVFLYRRRANIKRQGLLLLYRTSWGIKLIDRFSKRYKKLLNGLSYISIGVGYLLMLGIVYLVGKIVYIYVAYPHIVRAIKVPPIMPLIPYLPQAFRLDFLPPFYFTYWIIIIAIIAITHEFSHGIFMRRYGIKIKSTGFGFFPFFFPIFPAAFVEQDEKSMDKSKRFHQMAVLSAGTFANILTAIFFFIIMWLFFSLSFAPMGVMFDTYAYDIVEIDDIAMINGFPVTNLTYSGFVSFINKEGLNKIGTKDGGKYVINKDFLENLEEEYEEMGMYYDAPAINADLEGSIIDINNIEITSLDVFQNELEKYSPGDEVTIKTMLDEEVKTYEIVLGENPEERGTAYLGVGFIDQSRSGIVGKIVDFMSSFKKPNVYYESKFGAGWFIYNLLWWLVLISFSVALINMLPVGIFDGGRFFYLTILAITKSKIKAEKTFKFATRLFLFLLLLLMILWAISFF